MNFGLSIDPSVHHTGLVSWGEEDGLWRPCKGKDKVKTLLATNFEAMIAALDDELRFPWEWVAVEDVYQGPNAQTNIALAGMVYGIWTLCILMDIPFYKASTGQIDKACGFAAGMTREVRELVMLPFASRELGGKIDIHQAAAYCAGIWMMGEVVKTGWAAAAAESEE
jgi:hypothetical protein